MQFTFRENHIDGALNFGKITISEDEKHGFRPYELLVSSIAGCSGLVFKQILTKQRTELEELIIDARVIRNEKEANRVEKIILTFKVKGKNLNEKKLQRNLEISSKHCAMVRSVEDSIEIEENITIFPVK